LIAYAINAVEGSAVAFRQSEAALPPGCPPSTRNAVFLSLEPKNCHPERSEGPAFRGYFRIGHNTTTILSMSGMASIHNWLMIDRLSTLPNR
jgi:hypothetical protein